MTNMLLICDNTDNMNIAWRHFCYREYNASATVSVDSAMEHLCSDKPPQIVVYYKSGTEKGFFSFYKQLRENPKTSSIPLLVLADPERQKAMTEYIKMKNTAVYGISIDDRKLMDIMRSAARNGFERRKSIFDRDIERRKKQ